MVEPIKVKITNYNICDTALSQISKCLNKLKPFSGEIPQ